MGKRLQFFLTMFSTKHHEFWGSNLGTTHTLFFMSTPQGCHFHPTNIDSKLFLSKSNVTDTFNITCDMTLSPIQQTICVMFFNDTLSMFNAKSLRENKNYFKRTKESFETQVKMQGSRIVKRTLPLSQKNKFEHLPLISRMMYRKTLQCHCSVLPPHLSTLQ